MKEYIVETRSLKKYYQMGENTVKALDGVDFCVKDQEFVAIIGKSGSGKSTLLHMLGGLDVPTEGEVLVEGKCLLGLKKEQLAIFRRIKIGFIFQNYNLVPDLNVYENVILSLVCLLLLIFYRISPKNHKPVSIFNYHKIVTIPDRIISCKNNHGTSEGLHRSTV